jgi:hypothetical protein
MAINDDVDIEIRKAKGKLSMMEIIFRSNIEKIENTSDDVPYPVLTKALTDNNRILIYMYMTLRKELEPLKYNQHILSHYLWLGDTYFEYTLACKNRIKKLAEEN